jgi:hypothetical protein
MRSPDWQAVIAIRDENVHRWRKEHESVYGVDRHSGNSQNVYDSAGNVNGRSVSGHARPHTVSDGLTEHTTHAAGEGVRVLAAALEAILNDTLQALPRIAAGFRIEIANDGYSRTSWPLAGF